MSSDPIVTLDDIVAYLNHAKVRATYGAVADVVGGIAQGIGARLGGQFGMRPEASWVVNASTGLPTGYPADKQHKDLRSNREVITDGRDLRDRVRAWKGLASRPAASQPVAPRLRPASPTSTPSRETPRPAGVLTVNDLGDYRRKLMAVLDQFDKKKASSEGIRSRIRRLTTPDGPIPRHIAAFMVSITEMRNSAEYEAKTLTASESDAIRLAWQAIADWAKPFTPVRS